MLCGYQGVRPPLRHTPMKRSLVGGFDEGGLRIPIHRCPPSHQGNGAEVWQSVLLFTVKTRRRRRGAIFAGISRLFPILEFQYRPAMWFVKQNGRR